MFQKIDVRLIFSSNWFVFNTDCFLMLTIFLANYFQKEKEKKESRPFGEGFKWSQVFLKKYYPTVLVYLSRDFKSGI